MLKLSPGPGEAAAVAITPTSQVHRKTLGPQHRVPKRAWQLGVPARSLHVLQALLFVQGLQPADHSLVYGLQPLGVQVLQQQQDGSQDIVLGKQSPG